MTLEFEDDIAIVTPMHPALDVVGDTLYVTVRAGVKGLGTRNLVLTSKGEVFTQEQWESEAAQRGLYPRTTVDLKDSSPRWNNASLHAFQEGKLTPPAWNDVYSDLYRAFSDRLEMCDERYLVILTLFTMMTYFYPLFDFLPILHLLGPSESGKSRAALAVGGVAFNSKVNSSATNSTVFRNAHEGGYTIIITEADDLANKGSDDQFVKQLQGSCGKGEASVEVSDKGRNGTFEPNQYWTFSPRVLVSTKDFNRAPTLRNRTIRLDLMKTPNADQTKLRRTLRDESVWAPLRDKLYRLQLLRWRDVEGARDTLKQTWTGDDAPTGRTFDKWLPLAAIAHLVSEDVFVVVKELAFESMEEQQRDAAESFDGMLLKFAAWLVKRGDQTLSETKLYDLFLMTENPKQFGAETPLWARATHTTMTTDKLRTLVKGKRRLTTQLKRRKLIPQTATHTNSGNVYEIEQAHVLGIVETYLGSVEFDEATETSRTVPATLRSASSTVPTTWDDDDEWGQDFDTAS